MNKKIALSNLLEITDSLRKYNVTHWITDGTLLGYYREGDFITHDTDTDIGVMYSTFSKSALDSILSKGFKLVHIFGEPNNSLELAFTKSGVKTDIFFFYEKGDKLYHSAFTDLSHRGYTRIDYSYNKFGVSEVDFLGYKFYAPDNIIDFIVTKYGENWKTPIIKWNWATSPKNAVNTGIYLYRAECEKKFKEWIKTK